MNKEEILKAGRELDELVAEKVMGWVDFWKSQHHLMGYPPIEQNLGVGYDERQPVPQYSTDISAAWEVRDRMFEQPIQIRNKFIEETTTDIFHINPMMICKAALLAVMEETQ